MTDRFQVIDGGKSPSFLDEIQKRCAQRAREIRSNPAVADEINRSSEQSHATVRAAEEAMRRSAKGGKK